MADYKLDVTTQQTVLPFIIQGTELVSEIDPSIFTALHTDSEQFMGKYEMQRDGNSVVLTEHFWIGVFDQTLQCDVDLEFDISYHFVDQTFRSLVLTGAVYDYSKPIYFVGSGMNPFSAPTQSMPSKVNRVCFSLYIGDKKYLISDTFYDKIDFEAEAFQESTLSENILGLSLAQQIIEIMGVTK